VGKESGLVFEFVSPRHQSPLSHHPFHDTLLPDGTVWSHTYRQGFCILLRFPGLADFQVEEGGSVIRCWPVPGLSEGTLQHLYLNQVLPLALSQQGKLVLHAGAIEFRSGALAFLGVSGRGKSTLTASFATHGYRFLTDDGLVLEESESGYEAQPSHPSIRLWQDSRDALVGEDTETAPPVEYTSKTRFLAGANIPFCDQPRPLRRMYFLGDGSAESVEIQPVAPSEALMQLVRQSFLLDIEAQATLSRHFDQLSRLVNRPICFRLDYPRRYDALDRVREAIIRHANEEEREQCT
jgi:hypothetical protein